MSEEKSSNPIPKLLSGRYFITVCVGVTFVYATAAEILPAEAVASIISAVIIAYFNRNDRNKEAK